MRYVLMLWLGAGVSLLAQTATEADLTAKLAETEKALETARKQNRDYVAKLDQMTLVLTNLANQWEVAQEKIRDLETRLAATAKPAISESEMKRLMAKYAPTVTTTTNFGKVVQIYHFKLLPGAKEQVLAENVEYSGVYGRRVAFKEADSTRRMAFDVEQLHPVVLSCLGINAVTQKAQQSQQEKLWKQVEAAQAAQAAAEAKERQARKVAEDAARAEAQKQQSVEEEKQFQREMDMMAAENDRRRADAAMRAADAAMIRATRPYANPWRPWPLPLQDDQNEPPSN